MRPELGQRLRCYSCFLLYVIQNFLDVICVCTDPPKTSFAMYWPTDHVGPTDTEAVILLQASRRVGSMPDNSGSTSAATGKHFVDSQFRIDELSAVY